MAFAVVIGIIAVLTSFLQFSSSLKLHQLAMLREANAMKSKVILILKEVEEYFLEEDLNFIELGMEELVHDSIDLKKQVALRSLEIPKVKSVFFFEQNGSAIDLPTNSSSLFAPAMRVIKLREKEDLLSFVIENKTNFSVLFAIQGREDFGIIELLVDPTMIINEMTIIEKEMIAQGLWTFSAGSVLSFFIFFLFLYRLSLTEKNLLEKTASLQETNLRLARAYKSVGLGALTGHLMHALKSPLTNLREITSKDGNIDDSSKKLMNSSAIQIQSLVSEALGTLQEIRRKKEFYDLSIREIFEIAQGKISDLHPKRIVRIMPNPELEVRIDNLRANLILPILRNLMENSFEASTKTKVQLSISREEESLKISVTDQSGGISDERRKELFSPTASHKSQGTGLGLALSHQLAESFNATLQMEESTEIGTVFSLKFSALPR